MSEVIQKTGRFDPYAQIRCPQCGGGPVVGILDGFASSEAIAEARKGRLVLGGCCITGEGENCFCKYCKHRWLQELPEDPRTPQDEERNRRMEEVCRTGSTGDLEKLLDEFYPEDAPHVIEE